MTSQGHVTTASLKQAHKEDNREVFETYHSKLMDLKQYDVKV